MNLESSSRLLVLLGLLVTGFGALLWAVGRLPFAGVLGNLPGDFVRRRGSLTIEVPLTTMLLVSIVLTVLVNLVLRLFQR